MFSNAGCITFRVAVTCVVFACLVFSSLRSRFRHNRLKTGLLVALLIGITVAVTILFLTTGQYLSDYSTWGILLWLFLAVLVFCAAIKGSFFEILFIVLVVLNLYVNIMAVAKVITAVLNIHLPAEAAEALVTVGVLLACTPLLWILIVRMYRQVVEFPLYLPFWKIVWMIPALTYMIFYVKFIGDYWKRPVCIGTEDIVFTILWSFATYVFFCLALQILIQTYRGITASEQARLMSAELRMQEERYESLLENSEQTSRLRHDWRHHLCSIDGFVESGDVEALRSYLKKLIPEYCMESETPLCQNHVVDVILRHYTAIAEKQRVQIRIQAELPMETAFAETDLCIIFGNLLENAVEACLARTEEPRLIEIKVYTQGMQLVLMIKNTYGREVIRRGGAYVSSKHEGIGVGLASVKKVVEKYNGVLRIDYDGTTFSVYALLSALIF